VKHNSYSIIPATIPLQILFGNSISYISDTECILNNNYHANVVENLASNLIGLAPLVDNNNSVTFTATDVTIMDQTNSTNQLTLQRSSDGLWRVPLLSIATFLPPSLPNSSDGFTAANSSIYTHGNTHCADDLLLEQNIFPNYQVHSSSMFSNKDKHKNISYDAKSSYSARVKSLTPNDRTILNKVIRLHQRMGHPPAEAMCIAISGSKPMWNNSNLTHVQIRKVFNHYSCIA
jgi:hypothetical protein